MLTTGGLRPNGMSAFASRVYDVLQVYTVSPWNVLKVECSWRGVDPFTLEAPQLEPLLPRLCSHVARMTDDDNGRALGDALRILIDAPAPITFDF